MTPSDNRRFSIAVTGMGIVARNAVGGREVAATLRSTFIEGRLAPLEAGQTYPVESFDAASFLGKKGLRHLTRGTHFLLAAAELSLRDAGFAEDARPSGGEVGVVAGTLAGGAALVVDFDSTILKEGPGAVNPALFPQTVWNSSSSHVAIRYGLEGSNTTLSTGMNSGVDALLGGLRVFRSGYEKMILGGGFEELSPYFSVLAPEEPSSSESYPLSEGAAVLILEREVSCTARGGKRLAGLVGGQSAYCTGEEVGSVHYFKFRDSLMRRTLEEADRDPRQVHRVWLQRYLPEAAPPWPWAEDAPPTVDLPPQAGCAGALTGALAAALAAAPGKNGRSCPGGECEMVVCEDGLGRIATLLVERG